MSRSGYDECDPDQWDFICYRGAVNSAIKGKRGQAFLKEMLAALDALPEKVLIDDDLVDSNYSGQVCAIGAVGRARGLDMGRLDPEDSETVAGTFGIADALAREIVFVNDEAGHWEEAPSHRFARVRKWVVDHIRPTETA